MNGIKQFLDNDIDKIGKINDQNIERLKEDINITEMSQEQRALRLKASGGPDGITARLLNHIAKIIPYLVLGLLQEITLTPEKPENLSKRFSTL